MLGTPQYEKPTQKKENFKNKRTTTEKSCETSFYSGVAGRALVIVTLGYNTIIILECHITYIH